MSFPRHLVIFALTYLLSAELSYLLLLKPGDFATFWPPAGIYLAMLLGTSPRRWWAVVLAAGAANLLSDLAFHQQPLIISLGCLLVNATEGLAGAWLLVRLCRPALSLAQLRHVLVWSVVIIFVSTPLGALGGAALNRALHGGSFRHLWYTWWLGDLLGVLVAMPLTCGRPGWHDRLKRRQVSEALALLLSLGAATLLIFRTSWVPALPPAVLFLFLLWAALRFGATGVAAALVVMTIPAIWFTEAGFGPFSFQAVPLMRLLMVQTLVATGSLLFYILAAVMAERRAAEGELQRINVGLDQQVQVRTRELTEASRFTQSIIETAPSVLYLFDLGTQRNLYLTAQAAQALGCSLEELRAADSDFLARFMHPEDAPRAQAHFSRLQQTHNGEVFEFEYRLRHTSGGWRWFRSYDRVFRRDAEGRPCEILGIALDITGSREAEEKLRASEELLSSAFAGIEGAITISEVINDGREFRFISANRACVEWSGIPLDRWIGSRPQDLFSIQEAAAVCARYQSAVRQGETIAYEELLTLPTRRIQAFTAVTPLRDASGRITRVVATSIDITARKQAEEALRQSEERLRLAAQASGLGFHDYDLQQGFIHWTPELYKLAGISRNTRITFETVAALIHPDDREHILAGMQAALDPQGTGEFAEEFRIIRPDNGQTRWFLNQCQTLFTGEGAARRAVRNSGIVADITGRRRAEAESARLAAIVASSSDAILSLTPEGLITSWNAGAERIFGYSAQEIAGQSVRRLIPPERYAEEEAILGRIRCGEPIEHYETVRLARDGRLIDVSLTISPLKDNTGKIVGAAKTIRNITEHKAAEAALRAKEAELRRVSQNAGVGLTRCSREWRYLSANPAYAALVGRPLEEIVGRPIGEVLGERALEHIRPWVERALSGERVEYEAEVPLATGRTRHFHLSYAPDEEADGSIIGWVASVTDITERKLHELNTGFFAALSMDLNVLSDEREIMELAAQRIGTYLNVARCAFLEFDLPHARVQVVWDRGAEEDPGHDDSDLFPELVRAETGERQAAGQQLVVAETAADPHTAAEAATVKRFNTGALVDSPYLSSSGLQASLVVSCREARQWRQDELDLLRELSAHVWLRIERARAETAARKWAERFRLATAAAAMFAWENDVVAQHIEWSENAAPLIGCTPEELAAAAHDPMFFLPPAEQERLRRIYDDAVRAGRESFGVEFRSRDQRCWRADQLIVRDAAGLPHRVVGVTQDITERKRIEDALRESEEKLRLFIDHAPAAVAMFDGAMRYLAVSRRWMQDYRLSGDILGRSHYDVFPEIPARWREVHRRVLAGAVERATEDRVERADGSVAWLAWEARPWQNKAGEIGGIVIFSEDITRRKRAEAERELLLAQEQELRGKAEAATRSRDEFLSVVSHELRNPLNSILGYTRLIHDYPQDAVQVRQYAGIIIRSAKMQQQLIEDLLDTARIMTGKLKIEAAPADLLLVLREALSVVQPATEARRIELTARLGDEPVMVIGDATRLQQIAWNLLQNAIRFTPEGGRVELRLESDPAQARFIVSDTGKGIEADFLPHLFERFSQSDMSGTRRYGGLGLGLALVRELVELHGGTVEAASAGAGTGATFTVTLPRRAPQTVIPCLQVRAVAEVRTGPEAVPLAGLPRLDGVRVLVVDDQEEARVLVARILSEWGAVVATAASGEEALALLRERHFDVLVCDISMPEEDGYAVLRRIRNLEAQQGLPSAERLPAIALTALSRSEDRRRALEAGFQMHLAKPVEPAELMMVIASIVRNRERRAERD